MSELRGMMAAWGCTLVELAQFMGVAPDKMDAIIDSTDDEFAAEKKALPCAPGSPSLKARCNLKLNRRIT